MNRWRTCVLTLSFFAAGCTCGAFDPRITRFACATGDDCSAGFVCNGLECVLATAAGVDAGPADAGIDRDRDGVGLPADCDDGNPEVYPGNVEACSNGVDDDCDRTTDCEDPGCDGLACAGGGSCASSICRAQTEVLCTDGVDNDLDGQIDCADADCPSGARCDDKNRCTMGERCVADGGCEQLTGVVCNMPPGLCFATAGACMPDSGCVYGPKLGGCDDGLACTTAESCASNGSCSGMPRTCPASPNACLGAGTCQEPAGTCRYVPLAANACSDGQNCTVNDTCDGDGGCRGTPVVCTPPSQCHQTSTCRLDGSCQFTVRSGACDAGAGAGTCNSSFDCLPSQRFPYQPSNFTEDELPVAGADFTVSCAVVVDTTTPSVSSGSCATLPAFTVINRPGAEPAVLFLVNNFTVMLGAALEVRGSRPAIFAVLGNVDIEGQIVVGNAAGTSPSCGNGGVGFDGPAGQPGKGGGGGAGFGTPGGMGGPSGSAGGGAVGILNGTATLIPLRGGCTGGRGGGGTVFAGNSGGVGGGALQISAVGSLSINSLVTAFGRGGGAPNSSQSFGGGGGGSGGALLFEAQAVTLGPTAWVVANGGGGGEGGSLSTLNVGADGRQDSQPAPGGGMGTPGGGNGGWGGAATASPQAGFPASTFERGGGGGGGAVGRIRINAATSCSRAGGSLISPQTASCP